MKTSSRYMKRPQFNVNDARIGTTSFSRLPDSHPIRIDFTTGEDEQRTRLPIALTFDEAVALAKFLNRAIAALNGTPEVI